MNRPTTRRTFLWGAAAAVSARSAAAAPPMHSALLRYRVDATVLLLGFPVYSRAGVGGGYAGISGSEADGKAKRVLRFGGGSIPAKARGVNRMGLFEEVVREEEGLPAATEFFGFLTSSPELNATEARNALHQDTTGEALYTAIRGVVSGEAARASVYSVRMPALWCWANCGEVNQAARRACDEAAKPSRTTEVEIPEGGRARTFLNTMREAMRRREREFRATYYYNGSAYSLESRCTPDPQAGKELSTVDPRLSPERIIRLRGDNRRAGAKTGSPFTLWFDAAAAEPLPLRIEYQARSFLRLRFEVDPAATHPSTEFALSGAGADEPGRGKES